MGYTLGLEREQKHYPHHQLEATLQLHHLYTNRGVERTTGYPPGETIAKNYVGKNYVGKNCAGCCEGYLGLRRRA
jgi:hypothetical protein